MPDRPTPQGALPRSGPGPEVPLSREDRDRLRPLLDLPRTVHLEIGLHAPDPPCDPCRRVEGLRSVLQADFPRLEVEEVAPVLRGQEGPAAPPPWIRIVEDGGIVRFLGVPSGHVLAGWVQLLTEVAAGPPHLGGALERWASNLHRHLHARLFVASAARAAGESILLFARLARRATPQIRLDILEVETFASEARRAGVKHLPTVKINDFAHFFAGLTEEELATVLSDVVNPTESFLFPLTEGRDLGAKDPRRLY
jgi:hypothetical protein